MSEWISVKLNERYRVSRDGQVMNAETGLILKPSVNKAGYQVVFLRDQKTDKRKTVRVHRLVAEAFIDNP